jgi:4-amino-4-deoxy-L-arabinose transferase-like glycosyltransferase
VIACAVLLAAAVRVAFFYGIFSPDEMNTLRNAGAWWTGRFELKDALFLHDTRPLMFVPVAWSFGAFGVSEGTAVLWPFLASLGVVACVYAIARRLLGRETAAYAAFISVFFPLLAREGTRLLPGAVMNLCTALCVLGYVVSEDAEKRRGMWLFLSGVAYGAIQAAGELGVVLGLFFVAAVLVWRRYGFWSYWPVVAGVLGVTAVIMFYHWIETGNPLFKFELSRQVYALVRSEAPHQPLFYTRVMLSPLAGGGGVFYVAGLGGVAALFQRRRGALLAALWFMLTWLLLEFGSVSLSDYQQLSKEARYFSVVSIPTVLLAGCGMAWLRGAAGRFSRGRSRGLAGGAAVLVGVLVVVGSIWTLQWQKNEFAERRANLRKLRDHVRRYEGRTIYVTHWLWNTGVGFFMRFQDDYFPSGYDPTHALNPETVNRMSKNRYVQTLEPGEPMGPGLLLHDERLFDASRGATGSLVVEVGDIPEALARVAATWRLVERIGVGDRYVVALYDVPDGSTWPVAEGPR